jgi:iron complex transport system substrate-binding protein
LDHLPNLAIQLTDDRGQALYFRQPPERIVSLSPSLTDALVALDYTHQLAGLSPLCDQLIADELRYLPRYRPATADTATYPRTLPLDSLRELKPEPGLILLDNQLFGDFKRLPRELTTAVPANRIATLNAPRLNETPDWIRRIGQLVGRTTRADSLARHYERFVAAVRDSCKTRTGRNLWVLARANPPTFIGGGHYLNDVLTTAGLINPLAARPQAYVTFTAQELIDRRDMHFMAILADTPEPLEQLIIANPELNTALPLQEVWLLEPETFLRPGLRSTQALVRLLELFQPEVNAAELVDTHLAPHHWPDFEAVIRRNQERQSRNLKLD